MWLSLTGTRDVLVNVLGSNAVEVEDPELLAVPIEGVDILASNKEVDGKTLVELSKLPGARGVFLRKITRGATATGAGSRGADSERVYARQLVVCGGIQADRLAALAGLPVDFQMIPFWAHGPHIDGFARGHGFYNLRLGRKVKGNAQHVGIFHIEQTLLVQVIRLPPQGATNNLLA